MKVNGIIVQEDFIPLSNKTSRPGIKRKPTYITIHNTGNPRATANARMHTNYVDRHPGYISWHFTVDDIEIYQEMPVDEVAYHAGTRAGNDSSIGIEICETGNYFKAEENAISLVREIMKTYNIPIDNVVPHRHWSGKYCPHIILDTGWGNFISRIKAAGIVPTELDKALEVINKAGITNNTDYWKSKSYDVKYLDQLIINMSKYIERREP